MKTLATVAAIIGFFIVYGVVGTLDIEPRTPIAHVLGLLALGVVLMTPSAYCFFKENKQQNPNRIRY